MLGEPIVVNVEIINTTNEEVWLYFGREHEAWAIISLVDEQGQPASARLDPRPRQGGISSAGMRLAAGQHHHDALVVTRGLTVRHPGRYTLHVKIRLPYISNSELNTLLERTGGSFPKPWREMMPFALVQEQTFGITITDPAPDRLREIAEALRKSAATVRDPRKRIAAIRALLSMPEQYALESWKAFAADPPPHTRDVLLNELALVMSPAAANILEQFLDPHFGPLLVVEQPAVMLDGMYRAGDAALREHIEKIFAGHGKPMSEGPLFFPG